MGLEPDAEIDRLPGRNPQHLTEGAVLRGICIVITQTATAAVRIAVGLCALRTPAAEPLLKAGVGQQIELAALRQSRGAPPGAAAQSRHLIHPLHGHFLFTTALNR